jgi:peptide-methionine (S)-S-oxide reductase
MSACHLFAVRLPYRFIDCTRFTHFPREPTIEKDTTVKGSADRTTEVKAPSDNGEVATLGAGCFWCVEALFQIIEGVESVVSGYSGGDVDNPTYEEVCSGSTGHAEVCQITFDPRKISYGELLTVFWQLHDPTTLNRQGADVGTQYRSVIFYHNEEQKRLAEKHKKELDATGRWHQPVVTEISPYKIFYRAEDYHHNYYNLHQGQPYSTIVIKSKMEKFKKVFKDTVKE